jgi:two-component sensor histidine kinase
MEYAQQIMPEDWSFITSDLESRAIARGDDRREKLAVHELASRMLENSENVLSRFVELAMDLTSGTSAGLSLFDPSEPDHLAWRHLRGRLQPLNGTIFPKLSPCGLAMLTRGPQLSSHPERVFLWMADKEISLAEVLHIPLHLDREEPLGVLWVSSDNSGHFDSGDVRATQELASFASIALRMSRTEMSLRRALDEQERLAGEMSHRVKNVLTIVDALVRVTARGAASAKEMAHSLSGRIHALAKAQALARGPETAANDAGSADLGQLVGTIVGPYENGPTSAFARFVVAGPEVMCGGRTSFYFGLLLHELATNAAKYGALSNDQGTVAIRWNVSDREFGFTWTETGGPAIDLDPTHQGFGSQLIQDVIVNRMRGAFVSEWRPDGLYVAMNLPASSLGE